MNDNRKWRAQWYIEYHTKPYRQHFVFKVSNIADYRWIVNIYMIWIYCDIYCNYIFLILADYRCIADFCNYWKIGVISPIIAHSDMIMSEPKIASHPLGEWIIDTTKYRLSTCIQCAKYTPFGKGHVVLLRHGRNNCLFSNNSVDPETRVWHTTVSWLLAAQGQGRVLTNHTSRFITYRRASQNGANNFILR